MIKSTATIVNITPGAKANIPTAPNSANITIKIIGIPTIIPIIVNSPLPNFFMSLPPSLPFTSGLMTLI